MKILSMKTTIFLGAMLSLLVCLMFTGCSNSETNSTSRGLTDFAHIEEEYLASNGLEILFQRVIIQLLYLTEVRRHGGILILFLTKHQNITMKMLKVSRQVPYLMTII